MNQSSLEGSRVAIIGLGESGAAAARLSFAKGGDTYVSDMRADAKTRSRGTELRALGVDVDEGRHDERRIESADLVVVSPGIPPDVPVLSHLRKRGVGWISELEFAFRFFRAPLVAVTGTNGKTTTAALTAHLMRAGGKTVGLGGNIGADYGHAASLLALTEPTPDWFVVEVSSFQLQCVDRFRPTVGVVTNLAPDHLDRYGSLEEYYSDKANLFRNSGPDSKWVLPISPDVDRIAGEASGDRYRFSVDTVGESGAFLDGSWLTLKLGESTPVLESSDLPLLGRHNIENALAALVVAGLAKVGTAAAAEGLRTFAPLPHRLESVIEVKRVLWVNDSKATNVAATRSALESLDRPIVVLLGGVDKGESFTPLRRPLKEKARAAVVFGEAGDRIERELAGSTRLRRVAAGFESAVSTAAGLAEPGDILLLSPATSSYDMFAGYQQRGDAFRALARSLTGRTH